MNGVWWKILGWWFKPPTGIRVVRVIIIDDDAFEYIPWNAWEFQGNGWEHVVTKYLGRPLSPNGRVEIRYLDGATKRRRVLYPEDECDPTFPKPPRVVYLSAYMIPKDPDANAPRNVIGRVQKYHGSSVRCLSHMFPFEDPDVLKETYSHIKTVDLFFSSGHIGFEVQLHEGSEEGFRL